LREPVARGGHRFSNTLPVFDATGKKIASYRKIFLFRANLPDDRVYEEKTHTDPGGEVVTLTLGGLTLGLSICFDLRFPELYRSLRRRGAQLFLVPSAFTVPTGKAHWETLLRARAIENQAFVAAPAQTGLVGEGKATHGHSLVLSPWGEKLAELPAGEGVLIADIDTTLIAEAESRVAAWSSRRDDLFPLA
jgi:predicted amidohydrolase